MRSMDQMKDLYHILGLTLQKYETIAKVAIDFGTGEKLYPSEVHLISHVCFCAQTCVTRIAEHFGVTKGAASQNVAKLVHKGYLAKTRDPDKGSRMLVTPTDKGISAHQAHMAFHERHDKPFLDFLAGLSQDQFKSFETFAKELNRWMDSYLAAINTEP